MTGHVASGRFLPITDKGELLFSAIHNRTIFTGTPDRDTDNLIVLRQMDSESVDLIYLDPPFNSNRDYAAPIGSAAGKVGAFFSDMFARDDRLKLMQEEILSISPAVYSVIHSAGLARGKSSRSYLTFMATRLMEMRRVLKSTGSIYLHCDPTMSHPLKMLMDAIFGTAQFRNEIVWNYRRIPAKQPQFQKMHDIILFYSKNKNGHYFNAPRGELTPSSAAAIETARKRGYNVNKKKGMATVWDWEKFHAAVSQGLLPKGLTPVDASNDNRPYLSAVWDIPILSPTAKERTGYSTQKPMKLLTRIISASSNPGDIVLDPFCGCGTACDAAQRLGRKWIGIDASCAAGTVMIELRESGQGGLEENRDIVNWRMINEEGKSLPVREDDGKVALDPVVIIPPKNKSRLTAEQKQQATRHNWELQRRECLGCGEEKPFNDFTLDHKIPLSKGGTDDPENLQALCFKCNSIKSAGTMPGLWHKLVERGERISRQGNRWALGLGEKGKLL